MDESKKDLLCKLNRSLGGRSSRYLWGFGASVLLWGYGWLDDFDEVDVVVCHRGVRTASDVLSALGSVERRPLPLSQGYADFFCSYLVDGVLVNLLSGLRFETEQGVYIYRFDELSIPHSLRIGGERIPCTTLEEWKYLYELSTGRESELALIDALFNETGMIFKELYMRMRVAGWTR
jgi:hypothetical protein